MNEDSIILHIELIENMHYLGIVADKEARGFPYGSFADFLALRSADINKPQKPIQPVCLENNPNKQQVFNMVFDRLRLQYNHDLKDYEAQKQTIERLNKYPPTYAGFGQFIKDHFSDNVPFLFRRNIIPVGENNRRKHTYITGGSGSGKTEVLKSFVWHYLTRNTSTGIIFVDPHGTAAEQIAKFSVNKNNNRLIYIDPALDHSNFPCLNPFDIDGKEKMSDIEAENFAEEFRLVFCEILKGDFTEQMNTILIYLLPVVMKYPNSSIYDLLDFLEVGGDKVNHYINFAKANFKNKSIIDFLSGQYETDKSYQQTRKSLQTRLRAIFSSTVLQAVFTGKKTIDLAKEMSARKLIVFNLSKGKIPRESGIIGKFLIASLKIIALQRQKLDSRYRVPCHLFIDECQNFITPSIDEILKEARKYGLFLTLAQQIAGDGMSDEAFKTIKANTAIKLTGANGDDTLKIITKETGAELDSLKRLSTGKFSLWTRPDINEQHKPPYVVTMPTNTIDDRESMPRAEWLELLGQIVGNYYRRPGTTSESDDQAQSKNDPLEFDLNDYFH